MPMGLIIRPKPGTLLVALGGKFTPANGRAIVTDSVTFTIAPMVDTGTGTLIGFPAVAQDGLTIARNGTNTAAVRGLSWASTALSIIGQAAEGIRGLPTAVGADRGFINLLAYGYDGSVFTTSPAGRYQLAADALWSVSNHGLYHLWTGTPNGSTTVAEWMRLQNAMLGIGIAPSAGNGLLQLLIGTTKANGIGWDASTNLYPTASGALKTDASLATASARFLAIVSVVTAAGTTTGAATDDVVVFTGTTTQTYTLPAAVMGRRLIVKNRSTGTVTVNRAGSDTIDGGTTISLVGGANSSVTLVANGTDWVVV